MTPADVPASSLRLDKWLWFARFCKSRALAQRLVERGQVTVNGRAVDKPSAGVKPGDRLVVVIGSYKRSLMVRDVAEKRGPAEEARALYEEVLAPERLNSLDAALPLRIPLRKPPGRAEEQR